MQCRDLSFLGKKEFTTPDLSTDGSVDLIEPATNEVGQGERRVVSLRWQVRQKLQAGATRRKVSDYEDLEWLFDDHTEEIEKWIKDEDETHRKKFLGWITDKELDDDYIHKMQQALGLE
jgi:hypothetical protein